MNVGFVGMGNMGQMLVAATVRSRVLSPGEIMASNRSHEKLNRVAQAVPGIRMAFTNAELARECRTIFLCVKPGETRSVLEEAAPYITADHLLVAITNTIDIAVLERFSPARVAKVIPSVAHMIDAGVSLLMFGERCDGSDKALLMRIMGGFSHPHVIDESGARVASDLTSCGPAFLGYTFRALAQAARRYAPDLTAEQVDAMIRRTAMATCLLSERQGLTFDDIIDKVSTPGGVTADGIKVLHEHMAGVWEQVIETTICKEDAKRAKVDL